MLKEINGFITYQGPSMLDPDVEIMLVVTGLDAARKARHNDANTKTGAMVQTYIMRTDIPPVEAVQQELDYPICGDCIHAEHDTCYVQIGQGPRIVYDGVQRGIYPFIPPHLGAQLLADLPVRIGTYGDGAAIPAHTWLSLMIYTPRWTGYCHQWRDERFQHMKIWCMASCDTPQDAWEAIGKGWKPYLVMPKNGHAPAKLDLGTIRLSLCPASEEAGKRVVCADCLQCKGTQLKTDGIYIPVHGVDWKKDRYLQALEAA